MLVLYKQVGERRKKPCNLKYTLFKVQLISNVLLFLMMASMDSFSVARLTAVR